MALSLALLLGTQAMATDLYLPALPMMARDLSADMPAVQATMAAFVLAFGLAQLVWGPVADRFGRRPVLRAGVALFALASLGAALARDVNAVIAWRAFQGAGVAAAVVCARAMLRDVFEPHRGAHVMSQALTGLGLIAIAAPIAGGAIAAAAGWRSTMALLAAFGAGLLAFVVWRVPETVRTRNPRATHARALLAQLGRALAHPAFRAWTLLVCGTYGGLMVFLAGAGFVLIDHLGFSAWQCGLAMGSNSVAYVLGTFICRRLLARHGLVGAVQRGAAFTALAGVGLAWAAATSTFTLWTVLLPQWAYALGHGVHQACGQAGAVGPFPHAAGVASALTGFLLALVGAAVALWLGLHLSASKPQPYFAGLATMAGLTALVAWTLVRRHGASRA
ncbi:MAG TPA: Bcr/CflA family efflux MFS transporter [Burkholderiaceae bacterium]|nr:Bcr/CflA family efflux MFS transporter [Burkholderiaceae bacterium]